MKDNTTNGNFTEADLEQAIIELFRRQGYDYVYGDMLHRKYEDILLIDELTAYLRDRYAGEALSEVEIKKIINRLNLINASPLYIGNRETYRLLNEGFDLVRDDRNR